MNLCLYCTSSHFYVCVAIVIVLVSASRLHSSHEQVSAVALSSSSSSSSSSSLSFESLSAVCLEILALLGADIHAFNNDTTTATNNDNNDNNTSDFSGSRAAVLLDRRLRCVCRGVVAQVSQVDSTSRVVLLPSLSLLSSLSSSFSPHPYHSSSSSSHPHILITSSFSSSQVVATCVGDDDDEEEEESHNRATHHQHKHTGYRSSLLRFVDPYSSGLSSLARALEAALAAGRSPILVKHSTPMHGLT